MDPVIGIDLGTTFSEAAFVDDQGNRVIIQSPAGEMMIPSVVMIRGDQIVVGSAALNQWFLDEEHVVRWIKRSMGDLEYQFPRKFLFDLDPALQADLDMASLSDAVRQAFDQNAIHLSDKATVIIRDSGSKWVIHDGEAGYVLMAKDGRLSAHEGMSAVQISAEILKILKGYAEAHFGTAVKEAVITCPAYFDMNEVENTQRAGELAGFHVREIIREPVAAAVHYGVERMQEGQKVMVCDLGGGTFDATIMTLEKGRFKPLATMGDRTLGGHDWTEKLVKLVAERFRDAFQWDPRDDLNTKQVLYEECEKAKRSFSQVTESTITCGRQDQALQVAITREEFETRTEDLIGTVVTWCQESLTKANLTWDNIDTILLVGGSSRLTRMAPALKAVSGKEPVLAPAPDLAIAYGAAIMARGEVHVRSTKPGSRPGLVPVIVDRTLARSAGTRAYDRQRKSIANATILCHGTTIPGEGSSDGFEVSCDGQKFFDIPIVEFDDVNEYACKCSYRFWCLPNARKGDRIRVTLKYDISGIPSAAALDVASGKMLAMDSKTYTERPDGSVTLAPRCVVFALDVSGSMSGEKISSAQDALIANARELITLGQGNYQVGIVSFSTTAEVVCEPTTDMAKLETCVSRMLADGTTAMDDGIRLAADLVMSGSAGADREILLLTDGMPDPERVGKTQEAAKEAKDKGIVLAVLSIGSQDVDDDYIKTLSPIRFCIDKAGEMPTKVAELLTLTDGGLKA